MTVDGDNRHDGGIARQGGDAQGEKQPEERELMLSAVGETLENELTSVQSAVFTAALRAEGQREGQSRLWAPGVALSYGDRKSRATTRGRKDAVPNVAGQLPSQGPEDEVRGPEEKAQKSVQESSDPSP